MEEEDNDDDDDDDDADVTGNENDANGFSVRCCRVRFFFSRFQKFRPICEKKEEETNQQTLLLLLVPVVL
jgi:hypothetical protein